MQPTKVAAADSTSSSSLEEQIDIEELVDESIFADDVSIGSWPSDDYLLAAPAEAPSKNPSSRPFRFFDLPGELRNQIFSLVLPIPGIINITTRGESRVIGILDITGITTALPWIPALRTSRRFHAEASSVIYTSPTFYFASPKIFNHFFREIGSHARYVRHVEISCAVSLGWPQDTRYAVAEPRLEEPVRFKDFTIRLAARDYVQSDEHLERQAVMWYAIVREWVNDMGRAEDDKFAAFEVMRIRCMPEQMRFLKSAGEGYEERLLSRIRALHAAAPSE